MNSATSNVTDQAVDDCPKLAHCEVCHTPISLAKGHRPRRYCSDSCKQRAYLEREAHTRREARMARLRADYPAFSQETLDLLDGFAALGNHEIVERIAQAIVQEQRSLSNELARPRQHHQRADKPQRFTKAEARELEQARADLKRLSQERSREVEEFHQLSVLFHEQRIQLQAAENHIAQLEQTRRVVMLSDLLYEHGQALDFPELWYASPADDAKQKIIKGEVFWRRFCDRASAQEVKAAYEVAQQLTSNRHGAGE